MNYKFLPLSIACSLAISLPLVSCSDSEIQSSDIPEMTQSIFVVPENFHGEISSSQYKPSDKFYVKINEKIRICGIYSINGEYIETDEALSYYNSHKWIIDGKESESSALYYSFDKAGIHDVSFETVDHLGDTLRTNAKIYVNTPSSVTLQTPANKYNQVDGDNENGLELSWGISGIDPWETAYCTVYASYAMVTLWESALGNIDCSESVSLVGDLNAETNEIGDIINHTTETSTIYWGVRATIKDEKGNFEQVYSEIFSFSTMLKKNEASIIEIPVVSQFSIYPERSRLTGAILSASGDTLSTISEKRSNTVIKKTLQPQSNVKIVVCDSVHTEYGCDSLTIDLAPSTKTVTDTIFLRDNVKPNMVPVQKEFSSTESIKFYIFDNGSGVNVSKVQAIINSDTVKTKYENNIASITNICKKECNLVILAEDYARNKAPDIYWTIKTGESTTQITGPFAKMEVNK